MHHHEILYDRKKRWNMESMIMLSEEQAESLKKNMPDKSVLRKLADFFSIFADPTRIKIITALCLYEMCVSDIAILLNINQTTVSHQLKYLKQSGAVRSNRVGKLIYYKINSYVIEDIMMGGVDYLLE